MKRVAFRSLAVLVCGLALAQPLTTPAAAAGPDSAAFDKQMDEYLSKEANLEKIGSALEKYFRKQRDLQQQQEAKAEANRMEDQFKNPVKIDVGEAPIRGKKDAKITIVEFSDFQCPFCGRGAKIVDEVLKLYPNDVRVAFKHYPLPFHNDAKPAAKAAYAAGKQGKFWEMHDLMFQNQDSLNPPSFMKWAQQLGLNTEKFQSDMNSEAATKVVESDMQAGMQNGVRGTPAFFINGVMLSGAQPVDNFKVIVERWLKGGGVAQAKK
jgi:protein-disulfide isomerase